MYQVVLQFYVGLARSLIYCADYDTACVSQEANKEARKLRQDLFDMKVHLFELEFHPELVFRDEERKSER